MISTILLPVAPSATPPGLRDRQDSFGLARAFSRGKGDLPRAVCASHPKVPRPNLPTGAETPSGGQGRSAAGTSPSAPAALPWQRFSDALAIATATADASAAALAAATASACAVALANANVLA